MDNVADLTLRNGRVVTSHGVLRGGVAAHRRRDHARRRRLRLPPGRDDIDVDGKVIFPGVIDPHTHMGVGDNWGPEKLESDFLTESQDAVSGGITTLVTTSVYGPSPRVPMVKQNIDAASRNSYVDFRITALMVTREHVEEIPELVELGVRSFKYTGATRGPKLPASA